MQSDLALCCGVAAATMLLYSASGLPGAFYYDDLLLTRDGYGTHFSAADLLNYKLARPLTLLTYFLNYRLAGFSETVFHLTNFAVHAVNAALCTALVLALNASRARALAAGLTFAFHFLVIESVNYVWARSGMLSAMWVLLGLWLLAGDDRPLGLRRGLLLGVIFSMGFLSRPDAFLLPVFGFLLGVVFRRRFWETGYWVFPPLMAAAGWVVLDRLRAPADRSMGFDLGIGVGEWFESAAAAFLKYFELMSRPDLGSVYHPNPEFGWELLPGAVALAVFAAVVAACRKDRLTLLGGGFVVSCVGFVLLVPNLETVADRRIYLAALGLAMVWSVLAHPSLGRWGVALAFLLPVSLALIALQRNREWSESPRVLLRAERIYPRSAKVKLVLGDHYASAAPWRAVSYLREALELNPAQRDAHALLGNIYLDRRLWSQAEKEFRAELEIRPGSPYAWNGLGVLEVRRRRHDLAREFFRQALRSQPGYPPAKKNLELIADLP